MSIVLLEFPSAEVKVASHYTTESTKEYQSWEHGQDNCTFYCKASRFETTAMTTEDNAWSSPTKESASGLTCSPPTQEYQACKSGHYKQVYLSWRDFTF